MSSDQPSEQSNPPSFNLDPDSYTALRLQHATPDHIHLTTRRCFIGPIPEGWLKSHRKSWFKHHVARRQPSRTATFSAPTEASHTRQLTGLDGPSASVAFAQAFPQPDDANEEEDANEDDIDGPQVEITEAEDENGAEVGNGGSGDEGPSKSVASDKPEGGRRSLLKPGGSKDRHTEGRRSSAAGSKGDKSKKRSSFVTAPFKRKSLSGDSAASPPPSFHTARVSPISDEQAENQNDQSVGQEGEEGDQPRSSNTESAPTIEANSKTALISTYDAANQEEISGEGQQTQNTKKATRSDTPGLIKFNTIDEPDRGKSITFAQPKEKGHRRTWKRGRHEDHRGEIVKMEKMLVRVDATVQELPPDYNENDSMKIEARTVDSWREFVVVCRQSTTEDEEFSLQLYKTRVIPAKVETHVQDRSTHEIPLSHRKTKVNLYSSLDKTLVVWLPSKAGSKIHILRTRSAASAVEWYTFLRQCLGWKRSGHLQVNVPDLSVSLQLENPFGELENFISEAHKEANQDISVKALEVEKAVANSIIQKCIEVLEGNPEWSSVLETWSAQEKMGLAWKRYDRLEWVHGANEKRMYGTLAMQRTHDLELRPKDHYPTNVRTKSGSFTEPSPVEGFLIRLTSQKGNVRRLGRMYYKRLYFTTHNQYLCYCRPARAEPPPPPQLGEKTDFKIPSASEIVDNTPLIYEVDPFPTNEGQIKWLKRNQSRAKDQQHDDEAYRESERKINSLLRAEGYINLLHVARVQNTERGNSVADDTVDEGSDVDFHEEVPNTPRNDGKVATFDAERTFEIVMQNKLVIRLQAYDEQTKREWIHRLRALVRYWKLRLKDDMHVLKSVRDQNLERLGIDEEMEATLGQFASKWEVTRSVASPKLFNMCGISCCRAITKAGTLYHKPKRRSTFLRSGVILCHGKLLIFHGTLRKRTGEEQPHIQHNRHSILDLKNCYVYSGLLTEGDLLYQNKTFDANHPGHSALPKLYLEDGWTSIDEDTMTAFVIWQPRNKSWFKASEEIAGAGRAHQKLRHVSRLGAPGRSIVFKARSRTERDHWVTSIAMEVERMQGGEDIRVVNK